MKLDFVDTYYGFTANELETMKQELLNDKVTQNGDLVITHESSTDLFRSYFDNSLECALQGSLNEENVEYFISMAVSYDGDDMTFDFIDFNGINEECFDNEKDFARFCEMIEDEEVMEM